MSELIIRNSLVALRSGVQAADVMISGTHIAAVGPNLEAPSGFEEFDARGCLVAPALADVHVHFREPGFPCKETILTGSQAAAAGGYTSVCTMPNLNPAPDCIENLDYELDLIERDACIQVKPYATITVGRSGRRIVNMESLKRDVAGFSDDGSGVQDASVMESAMTRAAASGVIIAAHCEDNSLLRGGYIHDGRYAAAHNHRGISSESEWKQVERDIALAEKTGCSYHVCHISTAGSVDLIRKAKSRGVDVTCETAPHYLCLCEDDLQEDGRFKMNPPLRSAQDRDALIEGIKDGTIDMIATDHAPHTFEDKSKGLEGSLMGVVGLETAFPALYTNLVCKGIISLKDLVRLMSEAPRRRFPLEKAQIRQGARANLAVFDLETPRRVEPASFRSKGHSTPFAGDIFKGFCRMTIYKGNMIYFQDDRK